MISQQTFTCLKSTIKDTKKSYNICSELTIKIFKLYLLLNFEHIFHPLVVFLLLTLSMYLFTYPLRKLCSKLTMKVID